MTVREQSSPLPSHQPEQAGARQRSFLSARDSRGCAIEEAALRLGWLRECPYHGEPFNALTCTPEPAALHCDGSDEVMLRDAALLVTAYAETCPFCAREESLPVD